MKRVLTLAAFAAVMVVCAADTWWVQKEGGVDAEGRGTAEATPFRTIQYAIDAATAGDTILVKPGIYDEGYGTYTDTAVYDGSQLLTNRVHISKRLTLKSTDGAAVTHIVGKWSGDPTNHGVGPDAIRCIYATTANTVIEGFTIRDGAAHVHAVKNPDTGLGIDSIANQGGGVRAVNVNVYIVDCVISNCIGTRGGAMRYGTAVRCRIVDNFTVSGTAVGRDARFVNCFIARNRSPWNSSGNQVFKCSLYNCTCVENPDTPFCASSCSVYNSVIMSAGWTPVNDNCDTFARNSVYDRVATDTKVRFASDDGCVTNASPFQFFAPMLGDYRLLPSSDAVGCGDAAHLASLSLPSGVDAFVDIDGNAIPQTGAINAGCAQTVGPEPASGALAFENKECAMKVAGCDYVNMAANSAIVYAFSETVPQLYRVTPVMPEEGYEFYNVAHLGNAAFSQEYPLMDDTIWCAVPAKGYVVTNRINCAKWAYWVDPASGSDTPLAGETRGTSNAPFASIQAAVDASANNSCTVIHCAEGVYDNSEIALDGHADYGTNRVCVTSAKCVRIKGAGVGRSIIKGRLATGSGSSGGAGPDAIRCVAMFGTWSCVQGFTLADGSTDAGTAATVSRYGGAFYASSSASGLYDCLITNCIAYRGTATFQGRIVRCEIKGCPASTGGMVRNTHTYSSFLHDNVKWIDGTTSGTAYGNGSPGRYNTIVGDANCNAFDRYGGPQYNSIVLQKDTTYSSTLSDVPYEYKGMTIYGITMTSIPDTDQFTFADPCFVDAANGDYRVYSYSPAVTDTYLDDYWMYPLSDFNGNPIRFVNGKPMGGAFHDMPVPGYFVRDAESGTLTVTPAKSGSIAPGESVTVTATIDGSTRPFIGYRIIGDALGDRVVSNATVTATFTAPADPDVLASFVIIPIFTKEWWVDANKANDNGTGWTPDSAKKTLAAALACAASGDTVYALPGVYDQGSMMPTATSSYGYRAADDGYHVPGRVRVDAGIKLISVEGPERTIIKGEFTSDADGGSKNRGMNSMRCASLENGALLKGFTLTGGSLTKSISEVEPTCGSAVIAPAPNNANPAIISDCIISNNYSWRGVAYGGFFVNCRIVNNYCEANPISIGRAGAENCFIDGNWGSTEVVRFPCGLRNVTIGPNNCDSDHVTPNWIYIQDAQNYTGVYGQILNCLVFGGTPASGKTPVATNCIFLAGKTVDLSMSGNCYQYTAEQIAMNEDGTLQEGSLAIDAGNNAFLGFHTDGKTDINGSQRIYNGTVDIGCSEFDWRAKYSAAMGAGVTVTNASPGVTLEGGRVRLVAGCALDGTWNSPAPGTRVKYSFAADVDTGRLTGAVGPQAVDAASSGSWMFRTEVPVDFDFTFTGGGYGELFGFTRRMPGFTFGFR